jgi:transposase
MGEEKKPYCGLDIHKEMEVGTIVTHGKKEKTTRKFQISLDGYQQVIDWLRENNCKDVVMEATGVLWIPVYDALTSVGINVVLANPEQVKAIPGRKTDVIDSEWLATLLKNGQIKPCYVPDEDTKKLRELSRTREEFVRSRTDFVNRVHKILDRKGIALSSVYSDILCKAGREILGQLAALEGRSIKQIVDSTQNKYILDRKENLLKAEKGRLDESDRTQLRFYLETIDFLNSKIESLETLILNQAPMAKIEILDTMPGVAKISAAKLVAEIGDAKRFGTASQITSYSGMNSSVYQSAGKTYYGHITKKGNSWLRTAMIEVALAAIRTKNGTNTNLKEFYNRIKARHGHKKAVVALARKMLCIAWHMLVNNEPFDQQEELMKKLHSKRESNRLRKMAQVLKRAGYAVVAPPQAPMP